MTDLSRLSDDELKALYSKPAPVNDISKMSDAELRAAYAKAPKGIASDIGSEISKSFTGNLDAVKNIYEGRAEKSPMQGIVDTGKGLLAIPGMVASPVTGTIRALGGAAMKGATDTATSALQGAFGGKRVEMPLDVAKDQAETASMATMPRAASPMGIRPGPAPPTPSGAALRADAVDTFSNPAIKNIQIPTQDAAALSAKIENDLLQRGFRPTPGSAPGTLAEIKNMVPGNGVSAVAVDDMRAARRALNMRAKERDAIGHATPDATAATSAIRHIDTFLDGVAPELRQANANYSAGKLDQTLDYRNIKAQHRSAKTGSGSNIENTMRQEVDKIPDTGLRPEEIAARNRIVEGTATRNALRKIGKLGFGDGVSLMYHGALALPTRGLSLPVGLAGTAARKIGEALTRSEIRALSDQIRARSPTAQALMAAPRNPSTVSAKTRLIASALLGQPGRAGMSISGMMPANAEQSQQ